MNNSDLGIDRRTGAHQAALTSLEAECVETMKKRGCGRIAAISAADMAFALFEDGGERGKRDLRTLINHLIMTHSLPIMCEAGGGGGYYLPGDAKEAERFKAAFRRRSMTGLVKASRGSKAAFVDMMAQYTLGFDDPETVTVIEHMRFLPENDGTPAWVQLVTKFLDRISQDPKLYAAEIRRIQHTYGEIFVPREKVTMLKEKTAEFQKLLSEIA
jgi:hypothetical protein